jgi:hypothetical protein
MSPKTFMSSGLSTRLCGLTLLTLTAWRAQAQWDDSYDPDWTRNFHAGVLVGFNIKADFSLRGSFGISSSSAGIFDDGYVVRDGGGALTSDWGYNNASQYNASSSTLTMHRSTGFSTTSGTTVNDPVDIGLDLAYGGVLWRSDPLRIGWELGFGLLPIKITDNSVLTASVTRSAYTFDASGIVIPPAGYRGNPNSAGAVISSNPTGAPTQEVLNNVLISGSRTLDVDFFAFKLGPTLFWDVNRYIGVALGAGPAVGLVTGNLKYNETLNFAGGGSQNIGQLGSTDFTYGGYVNAMVTFHTVKSGDLYLGAQYMPMSKVTVGGAGRQAQLDLSGQIYVTVGINWPF